MNKNKSYASILRASSIMGGAAGIVLFLGMIRTKFAAILIGTAGVGLISSFTVIQNLINVIAGLGIRSSGVREIAVAVGKNDENEIARKVLTVKRISFITGLVGMAFMVLLSPLFSQLIFNSNEYILEISFLGIAILMLNVSGGQMAYLQGIRRIGDLARANIIGDVVSTLSAICFYTWLGLQGIVPSLITISILKLLITWYYVHQTPAPYVSMRWKETFIEAKEMLQLGVVFMWTALLSTAVTMLTISLITQSISIQAVGIYSAAFALSGMFVNFVLQAMGADYYPRLTGIANDNEAMKRLVNEQTEIALLLAIPGLLATIVLAPWIIKLFYSAEFLDAVELIRWFILGAFGRIISWPMGFIMLAMGKKKWFFITETFASIFNAILIYLGLTLIGLEGVSIAFFILYVVYTLIVFHVSHHLIEFTWSQEVQKLLLTSSIIIFTIFILLNLLSLWTGTILGILITIVYSTFCLCTLLKRLGIDHRLSKLIIKMPGSKSFCKIYKANLTGAPSKL